MVTSFTPLYTERLILREWNVNDSADLYELNSDETVLKYTTDKAFNSIGEAKDFIEAYDHYNVHGHGRWAVILKSNNAFLGWCGLRRLNDHQVDLGYRFHAKHWNNGYATEAGRRCLEYGFDVLNLPEIIGRVVPENIGSIHVLKKLGMAFWKIDTCDHINRAHHFRIINPNI